MDWFTRALRRAEAGRVEWWSEDRRGRYSHPLTDLPASVREGAAVESPDATHGTRAGVCVAGQPAERYLLTVGPGGPVVGVASYHTGRPAADAGPMALMCGPGYYVVTPT